MKRLLLSLVLITLSACTYTSVQSSGSTDTIFAPGQIWNVVWGDGRTDTFTVPPLTFAQEGDYAYAVALPTGRTLRFNHSPEKNRADYAKPEYARIGIDSTFVQVGWYCLVRQPNLTNVNATQQGMYGEKIDIAAENLYLVSGLPSGRLACTITRVR